MNSTNINPVAAIIQARFSSTRLPEKIFKELCGKPMLWHVYNRITRCNFIDKIIIATTILPEDDAVENFCAENSFPYYRGSSDDVLSRYYETAKIFGANTIVRITSDCPVIDPALIDRMIEKYIEKRRSAGIDYLSNTITRTFPRGLDAEIFSFDVLEKSFLEATLPFEREHVTPYIYRNPNLFSIENFSGEKDYSAYRWTVDTQEDFELIEKIYGELYSEDRLFLMEDILKLLEEKPELADINRHIKQKNLGE